MNTELIDRHDMLPAGCRVLCAVSGGADSMCLLHWLGSLAAARGFTLACAHFDHGLRGAESRRDAGFVEHYCRENGIEFRLGRGDVAAHAAATGLGAEAAGRELRYAFLEEAAAELGCDRIATAHNAEDNAETLLLRLCRGSGLRGLGGIPPRRGDIIRPLLGTERREILAYLAQHAVPHVEDGSNQSDDYARNRLRHHVTPVLRDINPAFTAAAGRTAALLREDEAFLQDLAREFLDGHGGEGSLPISGLLALPGPVARRALRLAAGTELSAGHVEALLALCAGPGPGGQLDLPGLRVCRQYDRLVFAPDVSPAVPERVLEPGTALALGDSGWRVRCGETASCEEVHKSFNIFFFPYDKLCGKITVRSRRDGDRVRLAGRNCTKSLKKLFAEARIPARVRDGIPVLADEAGVIAVAGFGQAERCAAVPGAAGISVELERIKTEEAAEDRL